MLTKCIEKNLDGYCTKRLRAILIISWKQHPTKQQLYANLCPISKIIQIRRKRHAEDCWRNKDKLIRNVLQWTTSLDVPGVADQQELTYNSSVRTQDAVWKTWRERYMIGTDGKEERKSQGNPCKKCDLI